MRKEISYIDMAAKKPSIIKQTQEFKDNSMIPTKESGLCIRKGYSYPYEHTTIEPQEIKEVRTKVIKSIELKEIDKLKMTKSFYKKILTLFAEKQIDSPPSCIIFPLNFDLSVGFFLEALDKIRKGENYLVNMSESVFFLIVSIVFFNIFYKVYPIKTLRYLRLSLLSQKKKNELKEYIEEKGLNNIVELCDDISEISCYDSDEEELKKIFRIK